MQDRHAVAFSLAFALAAALPGQAGRPTFVPKQPQLVELRGDGVQDLLAALPDTTLGKLLAVPEVAEACTLAMERLRQRALLADEVLSTATAMGIEPYPIFPMHLVRELAPTDLVRVVFGAPLPEETNRQPDTLLVLACTPRAEGRLTRLFDDHVARLAKDRHWQRRDDAKVDGVAVDAFTAVAEQDEDRLPGLPHPAFWMVHLPGAFLLGTGTPDDCGAMGPAPVAPVPGVSLTMNLKPYLEMFARLGGGLPKEFAALGFDTLERVQWRLSFAGQHVQSEGAAELAGPPGGFVGALLTGTAKLPAQALPTGAIAQLRAAIDHRTLLAALQTAAGGQLGIAQEIEKELLAAFTGGLAFAVAAPAPGGVIPRLFLSLGITDAEAFARLVPLVLPADTPQKQVTYEGTPCTVLTLPGLPPALQPTFCVKGGVLHVAESPISMRAFLKAQKDTVEAMDVGDAPLPQGPGDVLPSFDLRFDTAELYRCCYELWLPLFELLPKPRGQAAPLLSRAELPEPEAIAPHLGKCRGVLRRSGDRYVLQQLGTLGGIETAALAMVYGPMASMQMHDDRSTVMRRQKIANQKLQAVWQPLSAYKARHGKWPSNLGELFADRGLPIDALLVPGDALAEPVALPAGDTRTVRSSFRYFPTPVKLAQHEDQPSLLFVELAPQPHGRAVLADDGTQPDLWGVLSEQPIGQFGK